MRCHGEAQCEVCRICLNASVSCVAMATISYIVYIVYRVYRVYRVHRAFTLSVFVHSLLDVVARPGGVAAKRVVGRARALA